MTAVLDINRRQNTFSKWILKLINNVLTSFRSSWYCLPTVTPTDRQNLNVIRTKGGFKEDTDSSSCRQRQCLIANWYRPVAVSLWGKFPFGCHLEVLRSVLCNYLNSWLVCFALRKYSQAWQDTAGNLHCTVITLKSLYAKLGHRPSQP